MRPNLLAAACLFASGAAGAASAQSMQVDQIAAPPTPGVGQISDPQAAPGLGARQLNTGQPDARLRQMTHPAQARGPAQQVRSGPPDRSLRVAAPPPEAVDACEAAADGARDVPPGLDCGAVLEAVAMARASEPEARLLTGSAPDEVSSSRRPRAVSARDVVPDAGAIARRLASGDVQEDPVAQAVGAGFTDPPAEPEPAKDAPVGLPPTIIVPGVTTPPPDG